MNIICIEHPYLGMFTRSFVINTEEGSVLIDTGLKSGVPRIEESAKNPVAVLCTHGHWDHTGGHEWFQKKGAVVYGAPGDSHIMGDLKLQWDMLYEQFAGDFDIPQARRDIYVEAGLPFKADKTLKEGDRLVFGSLKLEVYDIPGHSDGSVCLLESDTGTMFTGDTVCGAGFNGVLPQINNFGEYVKTLKRLEGFQVESAHTAHGKEVLNNKTYHDSLREGQLCCERLLEYSLQFVDDNPGEFTIGDFAGYIADREGGKPVNSGACVTAGALLEYIKKEYNKEFNCISKYIL